jgi:beta-N-acetylglucosaminidase
MKLSRLIIANLILILLLNITPMFQMKVESVSFKEIVGSPQIIDYSEKLYFNYEMNLLTPSYIKEETLAKAFQNTKMQGLEKYFIQAEKETGINALYLAGLAVHESGWNTSKFAEKRNNLFGWQAYDNDLDKTKYFNSKGECILFVASKIKTLYLSENGMFHSGYTMESISSRYASDKEHSKKVYKNIEKILDKINQ